MDGVVPGAHLGGEDEQDRPPGQKVLPALGFRAVVVEAEVRAEPLQPAPQPTELEPFSADLGDQDVFGVAALVVLPGHGLPVGAEEVGEDAVLLQRLFVDVLVEELPVEVPPEGREDRMELAVEDRDGVAAGPRHVPPGPPDLGETLALLLADAPEHVAGEAEVLDGRRELALRLVPEPQELGPRVVRHRSSPLDAAEASSAPWALRSASRIPANVSASRAWSTSLSREFSLRPSGSGW